MGRRIKSITEASIMVLMLVGMIYLAASVPASTVAAPQQISSDLYIPPMLKAVFGESGVADVYLQRTGNSLGIFGGVAADAGGFKHLDTTAGCATAASAGAACDTTVTWGTAFANTSYTPVCSGGAVTSGVPVSAGVITINAGSVVFRTVAATAAAAQFTTIRCIAVHD